MTDKLDVLLLDGQWRQSLACARVYGRAGLRVGVATPAPRFATSLAGRSRWAVLSAALPDPTASSGAFVSGLTQLLDEQPADMVLPAHDGTIEVLREHRAEIERRTALPLASEEALSIGVDKQQTLALAETLGIATPRRASIADSADMDAALREIGLPAVLKPDRSWVARADGSGIRVISVLVTTVYQARAQWDYMAGLGCTATLQEWLPGRRDAVSLFVADGRVVARFAQASHREFPLLGGASVLCESIPLLDDIAGPSERLVQEIGLNGCSMVEYRRDAAGRPVLMELNPRMGGSVALAVRCGVNFPMLTYHWATGRPLTPVLDYRIGRRSRWVAGDIWNLKSHFGANAGPESPGRLRALTRFATDFVVRPSVIDPFDLSDPIPALIDMRATVLDFAAGRLKRIARRAVTRARGLGSSAEPSGN